jgi:HEAT repeat protein
MGIECLAQNENDGLIEMVVTLLKDPDREMRSVGFELVRSELKGKEATEQFAALLPKLSADAQVGLLSALADRGDKAARPAVLVAVSSEAGEPVRVAAVSALGYLGETDDIPLLAKLLGESSETEKTAARASLVRIQGQDVSAAIVTEMQKAAPPVSVALIETLTARRALDAIPAILSAALGDNPLVRKAAMKSLGQLASPEQIPGMVQGVLKAERGRERDAAEKAVMVVCARIEDADRRADPLLAVFKELNNNDRKTLLSTLGRVGGPNVLSIVEATIAGKNADLHAAGLRALCNWPDASVAPQLIELAKTDKHPAHQTSALRALIRVAPLGGDLNNAQRLELLEKAMAMATRDAERNLVIDRARTVRCIESLRFVVPYMDQPAHAQQACFSVVELAHDRTIREPNKAEFDAALDKVIAIGKDPIVVNRAQHYKEGKTWEGPRKSATPPQAAPAAADKPEQAEPANRELSSYPMWMIVSGVCVLALVLLALVMALTRPKRDA